MFALFVTVVQVVQEVMRIVGRDRFAKLSRRKIGPVQLSTVMINQHHDIHGVWFGRRRRPIRILRLNSRRRQIVTEIGDLSRVKVFAVWLVKDQVLTLDRQRILAVRLFLR